MSSLSLFSGNTLTVCVSQGTLEMVLFIRISKFANEFCSEQTQTKKYDQWIVGKHYLFLKL